MKVHFKKNFRSHILLLFISVALLSCTIFRSNKSSRDSQRSITILFPHIEYLDNSGNTNSKKQGHSIFVSKCVADITKEIIDSGQFIPKSAHILLDSLVTCQWIPNRLFKSINYYRHIADTLTKQKSTIKLFPVTPQLAQLVNKVRSEHFIFINGRAFGTSANELTLAAADTVYGLELHIYIIDSKSKEVLWSASNHRSDIKYDPLNREDLSRLMQKLLVKPI